MTTPLDEALDACADALLRGATIAECLAQWPEHAPALAELLPAVMAVRMAALPVEPVRRNSRETFLAMIRSASE